MKSQALRERIAFTEQQVSLMRQEVHNAVLKKNTVHALLYEVQSSIGGLKTQLEDKKFECEQKQRTLEKVKSEGTRLSENYQKIHDQCEKVKADKNQKENQLTNLNQKITNEKTEIDSLSNRIRVLDMVIHQPEPPPQYQLDGEYCINGIHFCEQHPPRQILLNGAEIEEHHKNVQNNKNERERLIRQQRQLQQQYDQDQDEHSQLTSEIENLAATYDQLENDLYNQQQRIDENKRLQEQLEKELEAITQDEYNLSAQLDDAENRIAALTQDVANAEYDIAVAQNNLEHAEQQLQQLKREYDELQKSLQQNSASQFLKNFSDSTLHMLKQLALKELAEDNARTEAAKSLQTTENFDNANMQTTYTQTQANTPQLNPESAPAPTNRSDPEAFQDQDDLQNREKPSSFPNLPNPVIPLLDGALRGIAYKLGPIYSHFGENLRTITTIVTAVKNEGTAVLEQMETSVKNDTEPKKP